MVRLIQSSDADITIGGHLSSAFLYSSTTFSRILADRIAPRGSADAAQGDAFNDFDNWEENDFWPAMTKKYAGTADVETNEPGVTIQISSQRRSSLLRHDVQEASVVPTETLTSADVPAKRHIEISLPPDMTCRTGDYLAILPLNQQESVQRVMRHFGLAKDAALIITSKGETTLPTSISISAVVVFTAHVELVQPVTKWNITALAKATEDEKTRKQLLPLVYESAQDGMESRRFSVGELLERFSRILTSLGSFIGMLPLLRIRQYSISSSPLKKPVTFTLTCGVLDAEAFSGTGCFKGVGSNFLASLEAEGILHVGIKSSGQAFHLPSDVEKLPSS